MALTGTTTNLFCRSRKPQTTWTPTPKTAGHSFKKAFFVGPNVPMSDMCQFSTYYAMLLDALLYHTTLSIYFNLFALPGGIWVGLWLPYMYAICQMFICHLPLCCQTNNEMRCVNVNLSCVWHMAIWHMSYVSYVICVICLGHSQK